MTIINNKYKNMDGLLAKYKFNFFPFIFRVEYDRYSLFKKKSGPS